MCSKPFRPGGKLEFGCGQCMPCRINRLRLWQGRLLLESTQHPSSLFVTLTYADQFLPPNGWLKPVDLQRFMKRLRKQMPSSIRFFGVGEYGDLTWRPHYHIALFGDFALSNDNSGNYRCSVVDRAWCSSSIPIGHVHVGLLNPESAGYLTRYTLKRMAQSGNPLLEGRTPEFVRMSLRPGIGCHAAMQMANPMFSRQGAAFLSAKGDAPGEFLINGRRYMLGRYLQNKLRCELGREEGTPSAIQLQRSAVRLMEDTKARESKRQQHANVARSKLRTFKQKDKL